LGEEAVDDVAGALEKGEFSDLRYKSAWILGKGGSSRAVEPLCRAMLNDPEIILADEPTGNLDSKTSSEIMGLLSEIHQQGNTVVLVTHEEEIARYAHRVVRLRDGLIESDQMRS
jgi:putative ABC transport system ATP-binding protein